MRRAGLVLLAIVTGLLLSLASLCCSGCTFMREHLVRIDGAGPVPGDPDTIIVPEGGSIVLSPDGTWLKVLDRFGNVVWEGDPR